MSAEENPTPKAPAKKPGPKSRAQIEAEIREQVEAEMREKLEAQVRAEVEAEREAAEEAARKERELASEARPISSDQVDGQPGEEGAITVHFVVDGFTLCGRVWYVGEEFTINPGTENWEQAHGVLTMDEYEQEAKWGKRIFRPGPWRGKRWTEIDSDDLDDKDRERLAEAQKSRDARYAGIK